MTVQKRFWLFFNSPLPNVIPLSKILGISFWSLFLTLVKLNIFENAVWCWNLEGQKCLFGLCLTTESSHRVELKCFGSYIYAAFTSTQRVKRSRQCIPLTRGHASNCTQLIITYDLYQQDLEKAFRTSDDELQTRSISTAIEKWIHLGNKSNLLYLSFVLYFIIRSGKLCQPPSKDSFDVYQAYSLAAAPQIYSMKGKKGLYMYSENR